MLTWSNMELDGDLSRLNDGSFLEKMVIRCREEKRVAKTWAVSGLLSFFTGLLLFLSGPLVGFAQTNESEETDSAQYIVEDIQGSNVQVLEDGVGAWEPAEEGQV